MWIRHQRAISAFISGLLFMVMLIFTIQYIIWGEVTFGKVLLSFLDLVFSIVTFCYAWSR